MKFLNRLIGGTRDRRPGVYEVYMPSDRGAMRTRVAALGPDDAKSAAIRWFTQEEDGPKDTINGLVTVVLTDGSLPAYWGTDEYKQVYGRLNVADPTPPRENTNR